MKLSKVLGRLCRRYFPNYYSKYAIHKLIKNSKELPSFNNVYCYWWSAVPNFGDYLSVIVFDYMVSKLSQKCNNKKNIIYGIGSIVSFGNVDMRRTVWGSGLLNLSSASRLKNPYNKHNLDIRMVRGPLTAAELCKVKYDCPSVYGDPSVLMPLIYKPECKKETDYLVISHYDDFERINKMNKYGVKVINAGSNDYKYIIDEINKSKIVISSSLHGVIVAESYGVPAILLQLDDKKDLFKYKDYYYSTNRKEILIARSIKEAIMMTPMELPTNLEELKNNCLITFPYDLFS